MIKRILITGLHGFIGSRFLQKASGKVEIIEFKGDIVKKKDFFHALENLKVNAVLHLAAKAHIDACEKDKKEGTAGQAWKVNVLGTANLAYACKYFGVPLFYLSTECVFDGEKESFSEKDKPKPINWYGETKLQAEEEVKASGVKYIILRAVLTFGHPLSFPHDITRIFFQALKSGKAIGVVDDQWFNITFIDDLVDTMTTLLLSNRQGLYHYGGSEVLTPFELALRLARVFNLKKTSILPLSLSKFFAKNAKFRLKHAVLNSSKIKRDFNIVPSNLGKALYQLKSRYNSKV